MATYKLCKRGLLCDMWEIIWLNKVKCNGEILSIFKLSQMQIYDRLIVKTRIKVEKPIECMLLGITGFDLSSRSCVVLGFLMLFAWFRIRF